jgi:hypothetical protein
MHVFMAGVDLQNLRADPVGSTSTLIEHMNEATLLLAGTGAPAIAKVHGVAAGAGLSLVLPLLRVRKDQAATHRCGAQSGGEKARWGRLGRDFVRVPSTMKPFRKHNAVNPPDAGRRPTQSLSDQRYQDLLRSASAFFTSAEKSTEQRRQEIIDEINAVMRRYGLTVDDLVL